MLFIQGLHREPLGQQMELQVRHPRSPHFVQATEPPPPSLQRKQELRVLFYLCILFLLSFGSAVDRTQSFTYAKQEYHTSSLSLSFVASVSSSSIVCLFVLLSA